MEEEKKDRFRGMKKKPYANLQNGPNCKKDGVRKRKVKNGSITKAKGLSAFQLKTQEEFMKVRPGETQDEWLHRTRFRRIRTEEEIAATKIGKRKIAIVKKKSHDYEKTRKRVKKFDKKFNFLKFYVFVINWASIKYNIPQQDIEVGFHFHINLPFTKGQFVNKCLLFTKHGTATFNRLKNNGQLIQSASSSSMFKLSHSFVLMLNEIYKRVEYVTSFEIEETTEQTMPLELEQMLLKMAKENNDILLEKKDPHKFLIK